MPSESIVKKVIFYKSIVIFFNFFVKFTQFHSYIYVHLFIFQEKRDSSKINPVHWTPPLDDTDEQPESRLARGRPIKVFNIS